MPSGPPSSGTARPELASFDIPGIASCTARESPFGDPEPPAAVLAPELPLCTDNAAMIAAAGYYHFEAGGVDGLALDVIPSLKLA